MTYFVDDGYLDTTNRAGRTPANKEATMNTPMTTQKPSRDEMCQEVCDFAHALVRRGGSPHLVVQAMIDGTLAFAGRIGEEAMRNYIAQVDEEDRRTIFEDPTRKIPKGSPTISRFDL